MRKHADGAWYTKDGQGRVMLMPSGQFFADEMMPGWVWRNVGLWNTKAEAVKGLKNHTRQFIW